MSNYILAPPDLLVGFAGNTTQFPQLVFIFKHCRAPRRSWKKVWVFL